MIPFNIFSSNIFLRASSYEPGYRDQFRLGFIREISADFWEEKAKNLADEFCGEMGERKQRWRNTKIITFLPNRPFPHSTAVSKHKKMRLRLEGGRGNNFIQITVFCPPCHNLMPFFTGMRERPTHNCITAVKWDAYAVENTAGNARRCNPGRQILLTLLTWQHQQKKLLSIFLLWSVESILEYTNYQSDCIPKSNNKQETLQTIYRGYYTVARRYEFYFRVAKQYFTNERASE